MIFTPGSYLEKQSLFPPQITDQPHRDLNLTVIIPCHNEENLLDSLISLQNCEKPSCAVEVIIVINASENSDQGVLENNIKTASIVKEWIKKHQDEHLNFYILEHNSLPVKHAGVGLARKIGMDEAVWRYDQLNRDGILVSFDSDCTCDGNYLTAIYEHFEINQKSPGCSIYYEHPLEGEAYPKAVYEGIIQYELFLRYYVQGLKYSGFNHAYHTVGSSMAVRVSTYYRQGGMNKRKAGEDFYFIHKLTPLGNYSELNTTRVIPSPRPSNRVPFGTGKSIIKWLEENKESMLTYDVQIFRDLKTLHMNFDHLYEHATSEIYSKINDDLPWVGKFLSEYNFQDRVDEIRSNSTSKETFFQRFFTWWNAFRILKLVHHLRDTRYGETPIDKAAVDLLELIDPVPGKQHNFSALDLLLSYRELDRKDPVFSS